MNPLPLVNLLLAEIDKIKISFCFGCHNARTLRNHGDSPFTCRMVGEPLMSWCACLSFCNFQTNRAKAMEFRVVFISGKMKFKFEK
jgi:hypothetical protein